MGSYTLVVAPQFLANFDIFGGSSTDPLLPMSAKFGVLEQTQGLHLQAKFHLNAFTVSASSFFTTCRAVLAIAIPLVPSIMPNFTPIGATCRPCGAKNLKIGL